jgi:hypothetical protein
VIVAPGNVTAALVAKAATTTIPIVFSTSRAWAFKKWTLQPAKTVFSYAKPTCTRN